MNITEALKLLQKGKKIYHEDSERTVYQLINKELVSCIFDDENPCPFYYVTLTIDFTTMSEGWFVFTKPIPIDFKDVLKFYEGGYTIKRIGGNVHFNNTDLAHNTLTMEDMNAKDWVIVDN